MENFEENWLEIIRTRQCGYKISLSCFLMNKYRTVHTTDMYLICCIVVFASFLLVHIIFKAIKLC